MRIVISFIIFFFGFSFNTLAEDYLRTVTEVYDGDTIRYLDENDIERKGRLLYIDAPELKQEFGINSRNYLSDYLQSHNYKAIIIKHGVDRYNRDLVVLYDELGININLNMIRNGYAWAYDDEYLDLQLNAQSRKVGLWTTSNPVSPADWRRGKRSSHSINTNIEWCNPKKSKPCSQLQSCEEALFWFLTCSDTRLDRNRNGIPCETLCKEWNDE